MQISLHRQGLKDRAFFVSLYKVPEQEKLHVVCFKHCSSLHFYIFREIMLIIPFLKRDQIQKQIPTHEFQRLQWKQEMRGEKKVLIQSLGFFHHAHLTDMMRWACNSKYKRLHKLCSLCWYLYYFWTNDVIWNVTQCNVSSLLVFFLMQIMMISKYTSYISMFPLKPSRPFNNTIRKEQVALLLLSSSSFLLIHLSPEKAKTNRNWSPKQILNKQLCYTTAFEIWQNMFPC